MTEEDRPTDEGLLDRYLSGDSDAFHELMSRHEDRVFSVCLRIMGDRESALDATQETFLTLYRKANRFSGRSAFTTWLYRVTVNTCYDQLRRIRRHQAQPLDESPQVDDPAQQDQLGAREVRQEIEAALARLPPDFRTAVVLVDMEDLSLKEVSDVVGVPVGTVKSRVFRARRLLAESLGNLAPPSVHPIGDNDA
ncbi:MAG: RNA polymerase sigma factor [Acidimicrobiia bacterium]